MSDPVSNVEIEDVLSSIRRLVSEDARPRKPQPPEPAEDAADRLVLTPALRVEEVDAPKVDTPGSDAEAVAPDEQLASLEATLDAAAQPPEEDVAPLEISDLPLGKSREDAPEPSEDAAPLLLAPTSAGDDSDDISDLSQIDVPEQSLGAAETIDLAEFAQARNASAAQEEGSSDPDAAPQDDVTPGLSLIDEETAEDAEPVLTLVVPDEDEVERTLTGLAAAIQRDDVGLAGEARPAVEDAPEKTHSTPVALTAEPESDLTETALETVKDVVPDAQDAQDAPDADALEADLAQNGLAEMDPEDAVAPVTDAVVAADADDTGAASDWNDADAVAEMAEPSPAVLTSASFAASAIAEAVAEELPETTAELDRETLRLLVAEIVREELQGALGERITRNVRKLVRREIHRVLVSQDYE